MVCILALHVKVHDFSSQIYYLRVQTFSSKLKVFTPRFKTFKVKLTNITPIMLLSIFSNLLENIIKIRVILFSKRRFLSEA